MNRSGASDDNQRADRAKARARVLRLAVTALPSRSSEEVADHVDWYLRYLTKFDQKKALVSEWRAAKSSEQKRARDKARVSHHRVRFVPSPQDLAKQNDQNLMPFKQRDWA